MTNLIEHKGKNINQMCPALKSPELVKNPRKNQSTSKIEKTVNHRPTANI